ncbi:MAG: hypothetical protein HY782_19755 [Chloroflexi bacterium]|nr:hypothetical protein [Chloroflexota bacterium]
MNQGKRVMWKETTLGDVAVDGLLAGLGAGVAMAIVLTAVGAVSGDAPTSVLARFDPSERAHPLVGALMHLAAAGVYGLLFGVIWRAMGRRMSGRITALASGIVYGLALFVLAETVLLPSARSPLLAIPASAFGLAHVVYGLTLGWLMSRASMGH